MTVRAVRMAPKGKRKKIIWNNNDCKATICLRPEATSTWIKCDDCCLWYHIACVNLKEEDIIQDKDWYCPQGCTDKRKAEFIAIKERLVEKVQELAKMQAEFGGVTISREMFKEKKNASVYNYSTEFPPTLRDLSSRIGEKYATLGDFKYDYQMMCKRLKNELLSDYDSRIQYIEYELDDIAEEILRPSTPDPEFGEDADMEASSDREDHGNEHPSTTIHFDIRNIKTEKNIDSQVNKTPEQSKMTRRSSLNEPSSSSKSDREVSVRSEPVVLNSSVENPVNGTDNSEAQLDPNCNNCHNRFVEGSVYSCIRHHSICSNCRLINSGCICPLCHSLHGDRRRLAIDHAANIAFRVGMQQQSSGVFKISPPKRKRRERAAKEASGKAVVVTTAITPSPTTNCDPKIMQVWSCTEQPPVTLSTQFKQQPEDRFEKSDSVVASNMTHHPQQQLTIIKSELDITDHGPGPDGHSDEYPQQEMDDSSQELGISPPIVDASQALTDDQLTARLLSLLDEDVLSSENPGEEPHCDEGDEEHPDLIVPDQLHFYNNHHETLVNEDGPETDSIRQLDIRMKNRESQSEAGGQNPVIVEVAESLESSMSLDQRIKLNQRNMFHLMKLQAQGKDVGANIAEIQNEIERLKAAKDMPEVMDPWQALQFLEDQEKIESDMNVSTNKSVQNSSKTMGVSIGSSSVNYQEINLQKRRRISPSNNQVVQGSTESQAYHDLLQVSNVDPFERNHLENQEQYKVDYLRLHEKKHVTEGSFNLSHLCAGYDQQWRPFLAILGSNDDAVLYKFEVMFDRNKSKYFLRAYTDKDVCMGDRWELMVDQTVSGGSNKAQKMSIYRFRGEFSPEGPNTHHVFLPYTYSMQSDMSFTAMIRRVGS